MKSHINSLTKPKLYLQTRYLAMALSRPLRIHIPNMPKLQGRQDQATEILVYMGKPGDLEQCLRKYF